MYTEHGVQHNVPYALWVCTAITIYEMYTVCTGFSYSFEYFEWKGNVNVQTIIEQNQRIV